MKYLILSVVALFATATGWAAEQRFPISLSGTVTTTTGRTPFTNKDLLHTPGDQLVMMIDMQAHTVAIEEWTADFSSKVDRDPLLSGTQSVMENFRMGVVGTTKPSFIANLEMVDVDWNHDGVDDHDGDLQLVAKVTTSKTNGAITKINATLIGVLNDSVNGVAQSADMLFRGKLATTGPEIGAGK